MNKFDPVKCFEENRQRYTDEWMEFLKFPSISADPAHAQDCQDCAIWLARHLESIGFSSRLLDKSSKPVVFAERNGKPGKPVVLLYGHYDVQPVDPLDEWISPPFQPTLRNGRIFARGAEDNKGQLFAMLKAIETLIRNDQLDCTVKIIIEGEEEFGSTAISSSLEKWKDILKADILMVSDTNMAKPGTPAIVMGLRGIISLEASLSGPRHDLHSGVHGGMAPNPATEIARLISSLHNLDGSIAVKGMYDAVIEPSAAERKLANSGWFDAEAYMTQTGVPPVAGEKSYSPTERVGFRPSIDINGIHSGYGGPGSKTIIPSKAFAKITARLVPGQDPATCLKAITTHLQRNTPTGLNLVISGEYIGGAGFKLNPESAAARKAMEVLREISNTEPVLMWEGASVPIVSALAKTSGAEPLLVGFGLDEDKIHAPNESYSLEQFKMGYLYGISILSGPIGVSP